MSIEVEIDNALVDGFKAIVEELKDVETGGPVEKAILEPVAQLDRGQNIETFKSEGAKSGDPWARLTKKYARWKKNVAPRKLGSSPNAKKLVLTGEMKKALTTQKHKNRIERIRGGVVEIGMDHHLGPHHQEGTDTMPARPPVRKSKDQEQGLVWMYMSGIMKRIAQVTAPPISTEFHKAGADLNAKARKTGLR